MPGYRLFPNMPTCSNRRRYAAMSHSIARASDVPSNAGTNAEVGLDILREIFDRRSCDTRFSECMLDVSRDSQTGVRQCHIQIEHQLHPQFRPATLLHLIATVPPVAPRSEFSFTADSPPLTLSYRLNFRHIQDFIPQEFFQQG